MRISDWSSDVCSSDLIITSGLGGRFPPGFPVGTVATLRPDDSRAFLVAELTPGAQLDRGRDVLLLQQRRESGLGLWHSEQKGGDSGPPQQGGAPPAPQAGAGRPPPAPPPPPPPPTPHPPGFPVGTVATLRPDDSRAFRVAELTPGAQLDRGRDVLLLQQSRESGLGIGNSEQQGGDSGQQQQGGDAPAAEAGAGDAPAAATRSSQSPIPNPQSRPPQEASR